MKKKYLQLIKKKRKQKKRMGTLMVDIKMAASNGRTSNTYFSWELRE